MMLGCMYTSPLISPPCQQGPAVKSPFYKGLSSHYFLTPALLYCRVRNILSLPG